MDLAGGPGAWGPLNFACYNFIIYYFFTSKTPDSSIGIQSHFMPPHPRPVNGMSGSATEVGT